MTSRPSKKYQTDGGASVGNVAALLGTLALVDREQVRTAFFDAFAFNVLVGNTDAHAKNYSVLLRGPRVALAPLYDAASSAPYVKTGEAVRSSMKVGRAWQVRDVTAEDWVGVATALAAPRELALSRVEHLRTGLPDAVKQAADQAPAPATPRLSHETRDVLRQTHRVMTSRHDPVRARCCPGLGLS